LDGWKGQLLRIDLTHSVFRIEPISYKILKDYLGGRGLAVRIYTQEVDGGIDPLDTNNKIVIASGGLCGTGTPCASIASMVTKSPVTNTIVCGRMQGHFGTELKFSGFDAIIIEGKAEYPVVVFITDNTPSIHPALQYWGRTTGETQKLIKEELKDRWAARESFITCIGPAGERGVNLATLVNDGYLVTGGVGIGKVLGAKNLKAIVVKGTQDVTVNNGEKCLQAIFTLKNKLNASPFTEKFSKYGNAFILDVCLKKGVLPINNFKGIAKEVNGVNENNIERATHRRACFSCPIGCVRTVRERRREIFGLDYETVASFGCLCGINDLSNIAELGFLCTEFGLDILNTASSIACAMELYEEGALKDMELPFGSENIVALLRQIGKNKGLGERVGQGGGIFTNSLNNKSYIFMGVKGSAIPPFDPRGLWGFGLHLATSNFGAYHLNGFTPIEELLNIHEIVKPFSIDGKPAFVKKTQDMTASLDALGVCIHALFGLKLNNILPIFNFVFGYKINIEEILLIGERIWNLERLFNLKAGFDPGDDSLPKRFTEESLNGYTCPVEKMLPPYYRERGWDRQGRLREETLERLNLRD